MKATIKWVKDAQFTATSGSGHTIIVDGPPEIGSGHTIIVDGPPEIGGQNLGPRPMELMLLSVGSCSSVDVMLILKKGRQQVTGCECEVTSERADTDPKVFTKIHLHFIVTGTALAENQVKRAVDLSAEKYCSASIMLGRGGVQITHDYEIRPTV